MMAAWLAYLKSRLLLPTPQGRGGRRRWAGRRVGGASASLERSAAPPNC